MSAGSPSSRSLALLVALVAFVLGAGMFGGGLVAGANAPWTFVVATGFATSAAAVVSITIGGVIAWFVANTLESIARSIASAPVARSVGPPVQPPVAPQAPRRAPRPRVAPRRDTGDRCPYCREDVDRDESVACTSCFARHHAACWDEHLACSACGETKRYGAVEEADRPERGPAIGE